MRRSRRPAATLKGPLHGGANEESMKMLDDIKTPERAEGWMMERAGEEGQDHGLRPSRLQGGRLAGADHARDRARSRKAGGQREMGADLRKARDKRWSARNSSARTSISTPRRSLPCWDFPPELNTPIFAVSRVAGWCAHVVEQHDHNRLIRPRSLYTGPAERPYPGVAIERRKSVAAVCDRRPRPSALIERRYDKWKTNHNRSGTLRAEECLLGLRAGEPGWPSHPQLCPRRRSRSGMETGARATKRFPAC